MSWANPLIGANWGTCAYACFCPCVIFGKITDKLSDDEGIGNIGCIEYAVYCTISLGIGALIMGTLEREELRDEKHIDGSAGSDFLVHCFCNACALAQEYHEVNN